MINLKKILITTDLSEHSVAAFDHGFSLGLLYASKIYVMHVAEDAQPMFRLYGLDTVLRPEHHRELESAVEKLDQFIATHVGTERKVVPVVRAGVPEVEIIRFAEEEGIDLIVLATHGWTGLRHILMGSVAEKVLRGSTVPVLTVKPIPMREEIVSKEDIEQELHIR